MRLSIRLGVLFSLVVGGTGVHAAFYENKNYGGGEVQVPWASSGSGLHGSPALVPYVGNLANDRISSIWTSYPNCFIVYEHENFHGRNHVISGPVPDLSVQPYNLDNMISSFIRYSPKPASAIINGCESSVAVIYEHDNQAGYKYHLPFGKIMERLAWFNDKASSVTVPFDGCLRAWVDSPSQSYLVWYNNPTIIFPQGNFNLRDYGLNDQISAFELTDC